MSSGITPMTAPRPAKRGKRDGATDAALLFDEPGPRGRIMIAVGSVFAVLGIAALLGAVLYRLDLAGQLDYPEWRYFLGRSVVSQLLEAAGNTLSLGAVAAVLTFPLGIVLGWLRMLDNRPVRWLVGLWIDAMRAVPMLLLVYFFLLVVPRFVGVSDFWKLALPIVMCTSATTAEVFRSGVLALDRGQSEAATALGLSRGQTMRLILAPQALRLMLPTLVTQLVTILKDSSLGYVVSYAELMYAGNVLISSTRQNQHLDIYLPAYVIIAALYVVINWGLGALARVVEARTR